jgi:hypothetical protein
MEQRARGGALLLHRGRNVRGAYEFDGEKIQGLRTIFDRLAVVEQAASGWLQETIVGMIADQTTRGLRTG